MESTHQLVKSNSTTIVMFIINLTLIIYPKNVGNRSVNSLQYVFKQFVAQVFIT